jgi:FAD/FMN-containing dehydrogenase
MSTGTSVAAEIGLPDGFKGQAIRPGDAEYDAARSVYNRMIDRRPAVIVRPTGAADIRDAVAFARQQRLPLAVRCGGHSVAGVSMVEGGVQIDLSSLKGVQIDPERGTAICNAGVLWGEYDREAEMFGLATPGGRVTTTGVGGFCLGGGYSWLSTKYGLTCDNLVSADLLTASGELLHVTDETNPELMWGLRGAGANFGVVTSFEFRLHPLDGAVTHGIVIHPVERAEALAERYRELVEAGPDTVWASFGVGLALPAEDYPPAVAGGPVAYVAVLHSGSAADAERDLAALRGLEGAAADTIEPKPYLATQRLNDEATAWGHRFSMRSAFLRTLPDGVVRAWIDRVERIPEGAAGGYSVWACGGAIAAVADEATAFTGREGLYWAAAEVQWDALELDAACRAWGRAALAEAEPYETAGRYVNDVAEVEDGLARSIYGDAKYERLVALKRRWDPDNVFRLNQNIRP